MKWKPDSSTEVEDDVETQQTQINTIAETVDFHGSEIISLNEDVTFLNDDVTFLNEGRFFTGQ